MSDILTIDTVQQAFGQSQRVFKPAGYGYGKYIAKMESPKILEIGCDIGDTAQFFLDANPNTNLQSIDPYLNYIDWNGNNLNEREVVFQKMSSRLEGYANRFKLHRMTSDDAVTLFEDESFDIIFIDGLHTYDQLSKDCVNYYPKLKTGGIFCGHDYTAISGVTQAITEFAAKINKKILTEDCDTWYFFK